MKFRCILRGHDWEVVEEQPYYRIGHLMGDLLWYSAEESPCNSRQAKLQICLICGKVYDEMELWKRLEARRVEEKNKTDKIESDTKLERQSRAKEIYMKDKLTTLESQIEAAELRVKELKAELIERDFSIDFGSRENFWAAAWKGKDYTDPVTKKVWIICEANLNNNVVSHRVFGGGSQHICGDLSVVVKLVRGSWRYTGELFGDGVVRCTRRELIEPVGIRS